MRLGKKTAQMLEPELGRITEEEDRRWKITVPEKDAESKSAGHTADKDLNIPKEVVKEDLNIMQDMIEQIMKRDETIPAEIVTKPIEEKVIESSQERP